MTTKKFQTNDGIASNGEVIISNTVSISANLTVDTNVLFVDSVSNRVGVGRIPGSTFDVNGTVNATAFVGDGSGLTGISGGGDAGTLDGLDSTAFLRSDTSDTYEDGQLSFSNASVVMGGSTLRMNDGQTIGLGTGSDSVLFGNNFGMYVTGGNVNISSASLFVDTTNNRVGMGTTTPGTRLGVNGVITATGGTSTQWNTAYGWGNHATAGYITGVSASTGLTGGGSSGSIFLSVDLGELPDMTLNMTGIDEFIVLDSGLNRRKAANEINLSVFNDDIGASTNYYLSGLSYTGSGTINATVLGTTNPSVTIASANTTWNGLVSTANQLWSGVKSSTDFAAVSDERLKYNIVDADGADLFDTTINLSPRNFQWKETGESDLGLIAQEVEEILPEFVYTDDNGMKSVSYAKLTTVLIGAVKELAARVDELESR